MKEIKTEDKTYRVIGIETRSVYTGNNTYEEKEFALCEFLYKGEWHKVKNPNVERKVAVLYRQEEAMGSTGNKATGQAKQSAPVEEPVKTKINEYGFEVQDSDNPTVEITDSGWKQLAEFLKQNPFALGYDFRKAVEDKISDILQTHDTLWDYDEDLGNLINATENENVTEDEYWALLLTASKWMHVDHPRYTVLDSGMSAWDDTFSTVEQAEMWANEHEDTKYVYDKWTHKYRKIGGKNWKK